MTRFLGFRRVSALDVVRCSVKIVTNDADAHCHSPSNGSSRVMYVNRRLEADSRTSTENRLPAGSLSVARRLHDFINDEVLPGTATDAETFWAGLERVVNDIAPRNRELVARRD